MELTQRAEENVAMLNKVRKVSQGPQTTLALVRRLLVGWLFCVKQPFETVFQSISAISQRGRKQRTKADERNKRALRP